MSVRKTDDFMADVERQFEWYESFRRSGFRLNAARWLRWPSHSPKRPYAVRTLAALCRDAAAAKERKSETRNPKSETNAPRRLAGFGLLISDFTGRIWFFLDGFWVVELFLEFFGGEELKVPCSV